MGNNLTRKSMEMRNLLTENDMYHMFESTFLRQQVIIIREVISEVPVSSYLAASCPSLSPRPVAEKSASRLLERNPPKFL